MFTGAPELLIFDRRIIEEKTYWTEKLSRKIDNSCLPLDFERSEPYLKKTDVLEFELSEAICEKLTKLSGQSPFLLYTVLMSSLKVCLFKYSGNETIVVGSPALKASDKPNALTIIDDISEQMSFRQLLLKVRETLLEAYTKQTYPFHYLLKDLKLDKVEGRCMLFDVALRLHDFHHEMPDVNQDITIVMVNQTGKPFGKVEFNDALFTKTTIKSFVNHYANILLLMLENVDALICEAQLLTEAERCQILVDWNDTGKYYSGEKRIHDLIEAQVESAPDRIAVTYEQEQITYSELNARANQLGRSLKELGVGPDALVSICMERSVEMLVGLLGILKAGGAYLPLDPGYPIDRLEMMLADSGARVLLTQEGLLEVMPAGDLKTICLDRDWEEISRESRHNLQIVTSPDHLAYVIYTSGSTGKPKGVMISHRSICNRLEWMNERYPLMEDDSVLQKTSFSFDASVWEFYVPLIAGARVVMARPGGHQDAGYLVKTIAERQITTLQVVPSMLEVIVEERGLAKCKELRRVFCGGEALKTKLKERFFEKIKAELINLYGPTESSIDATSWRCERKGVGNEVERENVPIGKPIANIQMYVLNRSLQAVPVGVAGELHIGGVGLARGYLDRAELTAERFAPNPWGELPGGRMYRTGDIGRYLPDGNIEYLRRADDQVKVRGYRIELGEVEAALKEHALVRNAVVVVREGQNGQRRLIAYVVDKKEAAQQRVEFCLLPNEVEIAHLNRNETELLYQEVFDQESYFKHGVKLSEGDCVFDVGANIGMFSLYINDCWGGLRVYAFEPRPSNYEALTTNMELHMLPVKSYRFGLSKGTENGNFTFSKKVAAGSRTYANGLSGERDEHKGLECETIGLSDMIRQEELEQIDLLKIDVGKDEADVLAGIVELDWLKIKQIVMKIHDIEGQVAHICEHLERRGYQVLVEEGQWLEGARPYNLYATRQSRKDKNGWKSGIGRLSRGEVRLKEGELQGHLRKRLPEYMMPSAIMVLNELPLSPNGKIDRSRLPKPEDLRDETGAIYSTPHNEIENLLANVWAEILRIPHVCSRDNFFEIGGHSLLATRVISRAREIFRLELPLRSLFEYPTIEALAREIGRLLKAERGFELPAIKKTLQISGLPLSFAQQRLWFLNQLEPDSPAYNIALALSIQGKLKIEVLERTLSEIIRRHEILRMRVETIEGRAIQVIEQMQPGLMGIINLSELAPTIQEEETNRILAEEAKIPFDIRKGRLIRIKLICLGEGKHAIGLTMHHIISDGWSIGILVREVGALYEAYLRGEESPLKELEIQYTDFAAWQREWLHGETLEKQLSYWKKQLTGSRTLDLPTDYSRPKMETFYGATRSATLPKSLSEDLKALANREGVTLFMLLLGVFKTLLYRYTGQEDICVGTAIANRNHAQTENLIGFFVNMLPLRLILRGNLSFRELLQQVREITIDAYAHQDLPFVMLVEDLHAERSSSRAPLFQVVFVMQNATVAALELPDLTLRPLPVNIGRVQFDLMLSIFEAERGLVVSLEYNTSLFKPSKIDSMLTHFKGLLEAIASNIDLRLIDINLENHEDASSHLPLLVENVYANERFMF